MTRSLSGEGMDNRLELALQYLREGSTQNARRLLELLEHLNPDDADVLYNLGMLDLDEGKEADALRRLRLCVENEAEHALGWSGLGIALIQSGHPEEAERALNRAFEMEPTNPVVLRNIGSLLGMISRYDESIGMLERAAALSTEDIQTAYRLGYVYEKSGALQKAQEWYERALHIISQHPVRRLAKEGMTRLARGEQEEKTRPDMATVNHMIGALEAMRPMNETQRAAAALELSTAGQRGFELGNDEPYYRIDPFPEPMSGLRALSYYYVFTKAMGVPGDLGIDLEQEYQLALKGGSDE